MPAAPPRIHVARSPSRLADGRVYHYAYVRYEVWDQSKKRHQPKPLVALGRTDRLDEERVDSLGDFIREWVRKDSSLPFEALQQRLKETEPVFRILCSRSFGLRWLVEQAWAELGYSDVLGEIAAETKHEFRVDVAVFGMVLAHLIAPQSKRSLAQWKNHELFFPEAEELTEQSFYRAMDVLEASYDRIEERLSERLAELGVDLEQLSHDTTSLHFRVRYDDEERAELEAERQARGETERAAVVNDPPLRMRGKSKSKRPDLPQVVLECVLGDHGLIVHHATHPGNTSDQKVTEATVERLETLGHAGRDLAWAGDTGTNSAANRDSLRAGRFKFVLGEGVSRTKVAEEVLATAGRYRPHPEREDLSYKCVRTVAKEEAEPRMRLYIIRRNRREESHKRHLIDRHLERIRRILAKGGKKAEELLSHPVLKRYVRRDRRSVKGLGRVIIDRAAVGRARKLAGKSVIATDDLEADPVAADDVYRRLFKVEALFRTIKTPLGASPIRHRSAHRIRAHLMIQVMAANIAAWLERKSGVSLECLKSLFENVRVQKVQMESAVFWERVELEEGQQAMLEKIGYEEPPKRFTVTVP